MPPYLRPRLALGILPAVLLAGLPFGSSASASSTLVLHYVSDLTATYSANGWGPVERDRSNGETRSGDGRTLSIAGRAFAKGLGVHAASDVRYTAPAGCNEFRATVGVDDEVGSAGSLAFRVLVNGNEAWRSGTVYGGQPGLAVAVPVTAGSQVALLVSDGGNGNGADHGDWAEARFECSQGANATVGSPGGELQKQFVTDLIPTSFTSGWGPFERDRSNGERMAGDGRALSIGGVTYTKGLGVHAPSEGRYTVPPNCTEFRAVVGVDGEVGRAGTVAFRVLVDGKEAWRSGTRYGGQPGLAVSMPVTAGGQLSLVVADAGNGNGADHADWADASFICSVPTASIAPAPTAAPPAPAPTASPAPAPTAAPGRSLFLQPFAHTSIWNLGIATSATFEKPSDPRTASLLGGDPLTWLNQGQYSHPVVQATDADPLAKVTDTNDSARSSSYRIPTLAAIAPGSDKHLHVVSPDGKSIHENWLVERDSSTSYRVGRHEQVDLSGSGIGPSNGTRAYGGSAIGGLIRSWEVDPKHPAYTGRIEHPIAMALRDDQLHYAGGAPGYDANGYGTSKGYVWPATEQDYAAQWYYSGPIPMGSYFAIPASVDLRTLGLTPQGLMLATAYQNYGGYVTDRSRDLIMAYVEPTAPAAFSDALLGPNWTASDLKKIRSQLRLVTNNTAATPNGGALTAPRRAVMLSR